MMGDDERERQKKKRNRRREGEIQDPAKSERRKEPSCERQRAMVIEKCKNSTKRGENGGKREKQS